jgi:hypothetical protein
MVRIWVPRSFSGLSFAGSCGSADPNWVPVASIRFIRY